VIVIPERADQIQVEDFEMERLRHSYVENALKMTKGYMSTLEDVQFLAEDSKTSADWIQKTIKALS